MRRTWRTALAVILSTTVLPFIMADKCDLKKKDNGTVGDTPHNDPFPKPIETRGVLGDDTDHNGIPDPWEPQDDWLDRKLLVATISVWVELPFCPYEVDATVTGPDGHVYSLTGDGKSTKWKVSEGQWREVVAYPRGERYVINIKVQASKPGSTNGYIVILDGKRLRQSASFHQTSTAVIEYTTQR